MPCDKRMQFSHGFGGHTSKAQVHLLLCLPQCTMALLAWVSLDLELSHLCLCRPWLHHVWFSYSFLTRTPAAAVRVTRILHELGFTNDLCRGPILRQGSEMNLGETTSKPKQGST